MRRPFDVPDPAPAARSWNAPSVDALPAPAASVHPAPDAQPAAAAPAPAATQHAVAAVESALDCIAHVRDTGRPSVALDLSFADQTRLAVRIELREGVVHTTFRTDSAELRQALSHEWSVAAPAVQAAGAERTMRLAEPVFASATGSFDAGGSGTGGGAHPREMPAGAPAMHTATPPASAARRDAPAAVDSTPSLPPATAVRLHAFA